MSYRKNMSKSARRMVLEAFLYRKPGNQEKYSTQLISQIERPPERDCLELANFQLSTDH